MLIAELGPGESKVRVGPLLSPPHVDSALISEYCFSR